MSDMDEDEMGGGMGDSHHWIAGAIKHRGALHRQLGVPEGKTIPRKRLEELSKGDGLLAKRARLALTLRGFSH